ncbi:MAG: Chaperone protein DnaK [Parcubacteria group bacterium GW2011_GWA2_48_9]|nr:MAG: Chaperone protein DnaK [Parcubacteria group bacterium GW2011_GWA2_48_9]
MEVSQDTVEVKATNGDTHLGGDDFDQVIIHWIIEEFKKDQGIDLSNDQLALQRLKESAEKAKMELSTQMETEINQPFITTDTSGPKHLLLKISRAKLESLIGELVEKTMTPTKKALDDAGLQTSDINEVVMVGGMTRMPLVQQTVEKFFGKKPHLGVNPDEVVAVGAAVQAGVLQGDVKDILLLDVTPLTLGLETLGSVMTPLIDRNTTVPTSKSQVFSTAADNQTSVEINVKAKDKATNKEQSITITASSGLSKDEVEKMKQEAAAHAEEDKKKKGLIDARNNAESLAYTAEKSLKDAGSKVDDKTKKEIEEKIEAVKKVKDADDVSAIKKATDELSQVIQKIGQAMYGNQQAGASASQQASPGAQKADEKKDDKKTVDAEYEEVKK